MRSAELHQKSKQIIRQSDKCLDVSLKGNLTNYNQSSRSTHARHVGNFVCSFWQESHNICTFCGFPRFFVIYHVLALPWPNACTLVICNIFRTVHGAYLRVGMTQRRGRSLGNATCNAMSITKLKQKSSKNHTITTVL